MLRIPNMKEANDCARLIYTSGPEFFSHLFNEKEPEDVHRLLEFLYSYPDTTFSREAIIVAEKEGAVQGLVIAHPAEKLKKLAPNEIKYIIKMKGGFFKAFFHILKMGFRMGIVMHFPKLNDDEYYISNLAVFEEFRGRGIAKQLLQQVEKNAQTKGLNKITLFVELDNNNAQRVYERSGFTVESKTVFPKKYNRHGLYGFYKMVKEI